MPKKAASTKTVSSDRVSVSYVEPHTLKPYEKNPRQITDQELEEITHSIEKFNFIEPMIVRQSDMLIVHGHQRLQAARILKFKKVPVIFIECTDLDAKILNVALNKLGGQFDNEVLLEVLREIELEGGDVELTGFDEQEIALIESELGPTGGLTDPDAIPQTPKKATTKRGDMWLLGDHRLICGDATKAEDIQKLMNGKRAEFLFTDPPYKLSGAKFGYKANRKYGALDSNKVCDYRDWLVPCKQVLADDCFVLVWENPHNAGELWNQLAECFEVLRVMAWYATNRVHAYKEPGTGLYSVLDIIVLARQGCPKGLAWPEEVSPVTDLVVSAVDSVYTTGQAIIFGTKPIVTLLPYVYLFCPKAGIVLDAFGGAGSTAIACEQAKRSCYMLEIEPLHCDVTVKRWENFTGKKAKRST